jgi:Zn-dependent protease with chaperone function
MQYAARLYGPRLVASGVDATLRIDNAAARIHELGLELPLRRLRLRRIGFSHTGLEIGWLDAAGDWALQVLDAKQSQSLLEQLQLIAPGPCAAFAQRNGQASYTARLGWLLFGSAILLVFAALGILVASLDPLATWAVAHVSSQQERQLGEQSLNNAIDPATLRDDTESGRVLRSLGQKLTEGSRYQYEFHVIDAAEINAFALPGGIIVVNTGLIAATARPEELAGVLAHEVQHVELQHGLRQIAKQLGFSACLSILVGDLDATLGGRIAEQLVNLRFSRDAEEQADDHAVATLIGVGIDPTGLPRFFQKLENQPVPPTWLSSHPAPIERQKRLEGLIQARSTVHYAPLEVRRWPPSNTR